MDDRHPRRKLRQKQRLLHRGVAAADDDDRPVPKKEPSQVAHAETPLPPRPSGTGASPGMPSHFADAPVAMISVSASMTVEICSESWLSFP